MTEQVEEGVEKLQLGADSKVETEGKQFTLADLPMAALMDLSLADLRDMDSRVGRQDDNRTVVICTTWRLGLADLLIC